MDRSEFDKLMKQSIDGFNKAAELAKSTQTVEINDGPGESVSPSMQFGFDVVEVQRVNLGPGDVLMVTVKNDDLSQESVNALRYQLEKVFPNNKVFVFAVGTCDDIKITIASQSETSYCSDCSCGKKEAAQTEDEHIKNLAKQADNG